MSGCYCQQASTHAALQPLLTCICCCPLQGAGGKVTDWSGKPLTWRVSSSAMEDLHNFPGEVLAAGDERVHAQALQLLGWKQ
jgi:hypothetical protein